MSTDLIDRPVQGYKVSRLLILTRVVDDSFPPLKARPSFQLFLRTLPALLPCRSKVWKWGFEEPHPRLMF